MQQREFKKSIHAFPRHVTSLLLCLLHSALYDVIDHSLRPGRTRYPTPDRITAKQPFDKSQRHSKTHFPKKKSITQHLLGASEAYKLICPTLPAAAYKNDEPLLQLVKPVIRCCRRGAIDFTRIPLEYA